MSCGWHLGRGAAVPAPLPPRAGPGFCPAAAATAPRPLLRPSLPPAQPLESPGHSVLLQAEPGPGATPAVTCPARATNQCGSVSQPPAGKGVTHACTPHAERGLSTLRGLSVSTTAAGTNVGLRQGSLLLTNVMKGSNCRGLQARVQRVDPDSPAAGKGPCVEAAGGGRAQGAGAAALGGPQPLLQAPPRLRLLRLRSTARPPGEISESALLDPSPDQLDRNLGCGRALP